MPQYTCLILIGIFYFFRVPSSGTRNGFSGRFSATPMRSNSRATLNVVTPNQIRYNTGIPQTAEKEKPPTEDRQAVYEKTQIVMDELSRINVPEFQEILTKGFKSMTTKQFFMILCQFMKPICGNIQLDGSNYIDYVFNFMQIVDYPYANLSKSTLKTPSAPHCQNAIIFFLAWLAEFSVPRQNLNEIMEFSEDETFISSDFAKTFMHRTEITFDLWNKNNEEAADKLMDETKKMFIDFKTGGPTTSVEDDVKRLEAAIDNLKKEVRPESLDREFNAKKEESKTLRSNLEKFIACKNDRKNKCQQDKEILEKHKSIVNSLNKEIHAIKSQISNQKMTSDVKAEYLRSLTQLRCRLSNEKEQTQNLLEEASEKDIQFSNLIQKKFKMVEELNNFVYKLASDLESISLTDGRFDLSKIEIKKTKIGESSLLNKELDNLMDGLNDIKFQFEQDEVKLVKQKNSLLEQKRNLTSELEIVSVENSKQKEILDDIEIDIAKIEKETVEYVQANMQKTNQYILTLKQLNSDIAKSKVLIQQLSSANEQLREQRDKLKIYFLSECKRLHEKRLQDYENLKRKRQVFKSLISEFNKIRKPLPDNVQKMVDSIRQEYQDQDS